MANGPTISHARRKAVGAYYTPPYIVDYVVRRTLEPLISARGCHPHSLHVLDPACGDGAFLTAALGYLGKSCRAGPLRMVDQVFGVDIDAQAVAAARRALVRTTGVTDSSGKELLAARLAHNIRNSDALIGPDFSPVRREQLAFDGPALDWADAFPEVFDGGGFDAIVGNPPYVNIRQLTKTRGPALKRYLQANFRCAQFAFDLYVLFLERAIELLRPGGWCGMIVPNKIATLRYAQPCRDLLLKQTTLVEVTDLSGLRAFPGAGVYPYILVFQKQAAPANHQTVTYQMQATTDFARPPAPTQVRQQELTAAAGFQLHGRLDVEARVQTAPLGEQASLHSGTTGFVAQTIAAALREKCEVKGASAFDFIVSRNIDRYTIRCGSVRFMKRDFRSPVLPATHAALTGRKRRLFREPKIVFAGMSRRLEAALDEAGVALGVQVYAASDLQEDPRYLLGLLNSKLLSYLFSIRYRAKRLAGGYLAINKSQLAQLPIRLIDHADCQERRGRIQLIELVDRMRQLSKQVECSTVTERTSRAERWRETDRAIDRLVYALYDLTAAEIEQVEATVDPAPAEPVPGRSAPRNAA